MLVDFRLDAAGVREVLRSDEVRQMVDQAAEDVRARIRAKLPPGTSVTLRTYTTDRGAASVTIAHVQGMGWQARDGVITRSVSEAGFEFKAWGG
ncbi:hypothetical protein ACIBBD_01985 [Streptomyces sp. NPDC051315]|uniref:hypothetical protein n=1 Tax=Streptomyces sp. NPDC051315 TaxID=3365650 RepID=UPI0037B284CF